MNSTLLLIVQISSLWLLIQGGSGFLVNFIPQSAFSPHGFWFRSASWEQSGRIYDTYFKIHKWKSLVPDAGAWMKRGFAKASLQHPKQQNYLVFAQETCRAEALHLFCIASTPLFYLFLEPSVVVWMWIYAIVVNLPCILIQRYNRPRLLTIANRKKNRT
ncbi:MAG: hypothetical protein ACRCZJ_01740 [Erysipelotrichaceae bacterium]